MSTIFPSKQAKQDLLTLLKILGGHLVEVSFSGGGDSGSIDGVHLTDREGNAIDLKGATLPWFEETSEFDHKTNKWVKEVKPVEAMPLDEILIKITEDALEIERLDWYNNEGGQGRLSIDLSQTPPTINLNVGINRMETDDHDFDYTTFDDEEEESEEK